MAYETKSIQMRSAIITFPNIQKPLTDIKMSTWQQIITFYWLCIINLTLSLTWNVCTSDIRSKADFGPVLV
jgi:hypothetical protein